VTFCYDSPLSLLLRVIRGPETDARCNGSASMVWSKKPKNARKKETEQKEVFPVDFVRCAATAVWSPLTP
jgi:hypothetical protein